MLSVKIKLEREDFTLNVNFEVKQERVTVLFGKSASGKSTIMRCIAGLEKSHGEIALNGHVWQSTHEGMYLLTQKRNLGYVFQEARLYEHISVAKNITLGLSANVIEKNPLLITLLKLEDLLERMPQQLSGGERRRVSIARALIRKPAVLLFDEPLAGIDQVHRKSMLQYIQKVTRGLKVPVLYVTHHVDEVVAIADEILLIDNGRVTDQSEFASFVLSSSKAVELGVEGSCITIESLDSFDNGDYYISAKHVLVAEKDSKVAGKMVLEGKIVSVSHLSNTVKSVVVKTDLGAVRAYAYTAYNGFDAEVGKECTLAITELVKR